MVLCDRSCVIGPVRGPRAVGPGMARPPPLVASVARVRRREQSPAPVSGVLEAARSGTAYRAWWPEEVRRLDRTSRCRRHPWLEAASGGKLTDAFDADAGTWLRDGLGRVNAGLVATEAEGVQESIDGLRRQQGRLREKIGWYREQGV